MQRIHILRVDSPASAYAPLLASVKRLGHRLGWLHWRPGQASGDALGSDLEGAAAQPFLRAVSVRRDRSVAVKGIAGGAVLKDVLREHFRGCLAVLVDGEVPAPLVRPAAQPQRFHLSGIDGGAGRAPAPSAPLRRRRAGRLNGAVPWRDPVLESVRRRRVAARAILRAGGAVRDRVPPPLRRAGRQPRPRLEDPSI